MPFCISAPDVVPISWNTLNLFRLLSGEGQIKETSPNFLRQNHLLSYWAPLAPFFGSQRPGHPVPCVGVIYVHVCLLLWPAAPWVPSISLSPCTGHGWPHSQSTLSAGCYDASCPEVRNEGSKGRTESLGSPPTFQLPSFGSANTSAQDLLDQWKRSSIWLIRGPLRAGLVLICKSPLQRLVTWA